MQLTGGSKTFWLSEKIKHLQIVSQNSNQKSQIHIFFLFILPPQQSSLKVWMFNFSTFPPFLLLLVRSLWMPLICQCHLSGRRRPLWAEGCTLLRSHTPSPTAADCPWTACRPDSGKYCAAAGTPPSFQHNNTTTSVLCDRPLLCSCICKAHPHHVDTSSAVYSTVGRGSPLWHRGCVWISRVASWGQINCESKCLTHCLYLEASSEMKARRFLYSRSLYPCRKGG